MVVDDGPTCLCRLHWQNTSELVKVISFDILTLFSKRKPTAVIPESFCLGRSRTDTGCRAESIQTLISGRGPADAVLTAAQLRSNRNHNHCRNSRHMGRPQRLERSGLSLPQQAGQCDAATSYGGAKPKSQNIDEPWKGNRERRIVADGFGGTPPVLSSPGVRRAPATAFVTK